MMYEKGTLVLLIPYYEPDAYSLYRFTTDYTGNVEKLVLSNNYDTYMELVEEQPSILRIDNSNMVFVLVE